MDLHDTTARVTSPVLPPSVGDADAVFNPSVSLALAFMRQCPVIFSLTFDGEARDEEMTFVGYYHITVTHIPDNDPVRAATCPTSGADGRHDH